MAQPVNTAAYRLPGELLTLAVTVLLVLGVVLLTAAATFCGSGLLVLSLIALSFSFTRAHHQALIQHAHRATAATAPGLYKQIEICQRRLQPGDLEVFVAPVRQLNAYTFGVSSPKVLVIYQPMLGLMDAEELRFVMGHEMGHVRLGHTWLNSLIGGMAGIPSSVFVTTLLALAFRSWNRTCEYSADRAGLLACGNVDKAVTAMIKLSAPTANLTPEKAERALQRLDAEDENPANVFNELLSTHPLTIRRIEHIRRFAASGLYKRLQGLVDQNLRAV